MSKTFTKQDFKAFEELIGDVVERKLVPVHERFSSLQSSVDGYFKKTLGLHQEFEVLRAQHNQMKHTLVRKNVATEQELSITGS